jgi:hypothetical protein
MARGDKTWLGGATEIDCAEALLALNTTASIGKIERHMGAVQIETDTDW